MLVDWSSDSSHVYVAEIESVSTQVWALPVSGEPGCRLTDSTLVKGPVMANTADQIVFVGQDF